MEKNANLAFAALIASIMPEKEILEKLKSSLDQYLLLKTEETKMELKAGIQLYTIKSLIDQVGGIEKLLQEKGKFDQFMELGNSVKESS